MVSNLGVQFRLGPECVLGQRVRVWSGFMAGRGRGVAGLSGKVRIVRVHWFEHGVVVWGPCIGAFNLA